MRISGGAQCFEPTASIDSASSDDSIEYWRLYGVPQQFTGGGGNADSAWVARDSKVSRTWIGTAN